MGRGQVTDHSLLTEEVVPSRRQARKEVSCPCFRLLLELALRNSVGMAVFCDCYTVPDICFLLWSQGLYVWGPDEHGGATQAPPKHHRAFSLGQGGSQAVEQQNHLEGLWKR